MKILIAFAKAAQEHWQARLQAGGVETEAIAPPTVTDDEVVGLPEPKKGVGILVNARVASVCKGKRDDLFALPAGAPQTQEPIGLDFLVKV